MTWVGLDVHARSTLAAAIDRESGELSRARFAVGSDEGGAWTQAPRRWLAAQQSTHTPTELAFVDYLAAIDGLVARRAALDERLSRLAGEPELSPTVARLRCFRGIETLTALALCLEIG